MPWQQHNKHVISEIKKTWQSALQDQHNPTRWNKHKSKKQAMALK